MIPKQSLLNKYFDKSISVYFRKKDRGFFKIKQYKKINQELKLESMPLIKSFAVKKIDFIKNSYRCRTPKVIKVVKTDLVLNFSLVTSNYISASPELVAKSWFFRPTVISISSWIFLSLILKKGQLITTLKSLTNSLNKETLNFGEKLFISNSQYIFFLNTFEGYLKDKSSFAFNIKTLIFLSFFNVWSPAVAYTLNAPKKEWKNLKTFNFETFNTYDSFFFTFKNWANSLPLSIINRVTLRGKYLKFLPIRSNFQNIRILNELHAVKNISVGLLNKLRKNKFKSFIQGRNFWTFTFLRFYKNKIVKINNLKSNEIKLIIWKSSNQNSFLKVLNRKMLKFRKFLWRNRFIWGLNNKFFKGNKFERVLFRNKTSTFLNKAKISTSSLSLKNLLYLLNRIEDKIDCLTEGENQKRVILVYNLIKQLIFKKTQNLRLKQSLLIKKKKIGLKKRRWKTFIKKSILKQINLKKPGNTKTLIFVKKLLEKLNMNKKSLKLLKKKYNNNLKFNLQYKKVKQVSNSFDKKKLDLKLQFKNKLKRNLYPLFKNNKTRLKFILAQIKLKYMLNNKNLNHIKSYILIKQIIRRVKANIGFAKKIKGLTFNLLNKNIKIKSRFKKEKLMGKNSIKFSKKVRSKVKKKKITYKNKVDLAEKNNKLKTSVNKSKKKNIKYKKNFEIILNTLKKLKNFEVKRDLNRVRLDKIKIKNESMRFKLKKIKFKKRSKLFKWKKIKYKKNNSRFRLKKKSYKFSKLPKIIKVDDQYSHILKNQNAFTLMYNKRINFFFINALAYAKYTYNIDKSLKAKRFWKASKLLSLNERKEINRNKYIGIYIKDFVRVGFIGMLFKNLTFLARFVAFLIGELPRNRRETVFLRNTGKSLIKMSGQRDEINGLRFKFKGRINKWNRTKYVIARRNSITTNQFSKRILHATTHAINKKGTLGIHLWIQYNYSFRKYYRPDLEYVYSNLIRQSFPMYIKYSIKRLKLLKHYKPLIRKFYSPKE